MKITKTPAASFLLLFFISMLSFESFAQVSPTLGVGLGELTMKKGTIDVEVLTEIIMEKQKELKKEALKRFLFDKFPSGNFATKFYIQNCLYTLMNEKNPQVIKKEIMELTTNYSIALGLAVVYDYKSDDYNLTDPQIRRLITQINDSIDKTNVATQNGLDYQLLVDIVSLSLSNSKKMREKGFYKIPVNYMVGEQYGHLIQNKLSDPKKTTGTEDYMKKKLDTLSLKITQQIDNYIQNYDVIQEYYFTFKDKKIADIKQALLEDYNKEILRLYPTDGFTELLKSIGSTNSNFKSAFASYADKITSYNAKKSQNENYDKLKIYLEQINKILPVLEKNNQSLQKTAIPITSLGMSIKSDSLISPMAIQKQIQIQNQIQNKIQTQTQTQTQVTTDSLKKNIEQYNDDKALNMDLKKRLLEARSNIVSLNSFLQAPNISPDVARLEDQKYVKQLLETMAKNDHPYPQDQMDTATNDIKESLKVILQKDDFLQLYLKFLVNNLLLKKDLSLGLDLKSEQGMKITQEYSQTISTFYSYLAVLANKNTVTIGDINFIEKNIIPELLKYSFFTEKENINSSITSFRILSNLLKLKVINDANAGGALTYNVRLNSIFTFVSNLDKLDQAQTYQSVIDLIRENNENVSKCLPDKFQPIYTLFINGIKKYTLLNSSEQYIEVDVVSFLNDLQQYYNKENKSWFSLYFTLGISENFFPKSVTLPGASEPISNVGFASEKIGVQFTFYTFRKSEKEGFKNLVKDRVYTNYKNPFLNKVYGIIYASGLLYSLANTTTNENFDFPHVGLGGGLRFYNALDFNVSYCLPFIEGEDFGKNGFFSIGLDIPLGEYLEKLGKKK